MILRVIPSLIFAGTALGQAHNFMPEVKKSRVAATALFRLLDRKIIIDMDKPDGIKCTKVEIEG